MKIRKNVKALSPVVASIILIAVTVAVSIAVAAWMGALTFTFTKTEELKILSHSWNTVIANPAHCYLKVRNTASSPLTLAGVQVNNANPTSQNATGTIAAGAEAVIDVEYGYLAGNKYDFTITTSAGNKYPYTANAPT